jgi:hypothetical protein
MCLGTCCGRKKGSDVGLGMLNDSINVEGFVGDGGNESLRLDSMKT